MSNEIEKMGVIRKCPLCKQRREFYKNKASKNGLDSKCKECSRSLVNRRYKLNKKDGRQKAREYYEKNKEVVIERNTNYGKEYYKRNSKVNAQKYNARAQVKYYLKSGKIVKPQKCDECTLGGRIEGHHEDYSKPLQINWLCTKCHAERHHGKV